jgi:RimJ/RimL family protein N-acetyltransferase
MNAASLRHRQDLLAAPGPAPVIQTGRLTLRPHRLADADSIAQSLSDYAVTRMMARVPAPFDRQDALDWLVSRIGGDGWALAVTERDDIHIGVVSLEQRHGRWHLAYWLNRYFWRRGIMGEAVAPTIERFGRRMPETSIHSGAFADNPASLRLQEKLGFKVSGCTELYSFARGTMAPHIETILAPGALRISQAA